MNYLGMFRGFVLKNAKNTGKVKVWCPSVHANLFEERIRPKTIFEGSTTDIVEGMNQSEVDALSEMLPWATIAQPLIGGGGTGYSYGGEKSYGDGAPFYSGTISVVDGKVDHNELRGFLFNAVKGTSLNGFVPSDGSKYGITTGSPEEWANYFFKIAQYEGLNEPLDSEDKRDQGVGGSFGLFRVSPNNGGSPYFANPTREKWTLEEVVDPVNNTNTAIAIHNRNVIRDGSIIGTDGNGSTGGAGGYYNMTTMIKLEKDWAAGNWPSMDYSGIAPNATPPTVEGSSEETDFAVPDSNPSALPPVDGASSVAVKVSTQTQKPAAAFTGDLQIGHFDEARGIYYGARNNWKGQFGWPPNKTVLSLDFNAGGGNGPEIAGPNSSDPIVSFLESRLSQLYSQQGFSNTRASFFKQFSPSWGRGKVFFLEPFFKEDTDAKNFFLSSAGISAYANILNEFISNNTGRYVVMSSHEQTSGGSRVGGDATGTVVDGINETAWGLKVIAAMLGREPAICDEFDAVGTKSPEQIAEEAVLTEAGVDSSKFEELAGIGKEILEQKAIVAVSPPVTSAIETAKLNVLRSQRQTIWDSLDAGLTNEQLSIKSKYTPRDYSSIPIASKVNPNSCSVAHSAFSNTARGSFSIPDVGSAVFCFFEGGDPDFPVVFAHSHSEQDYASVYNINSPTPSYPEEQIGEEANIYRNEYVNNQRGGSFSIDSTTGNEGFKLTSYQGGSYEANKMGTTEVAQRSKTSLVQGDEFKTVRGDKLESIDYDSEKIIKGDSTEYYGDIKNDFPITQKLKDMHKPVHDKLQLFDLKRTDNTDDLDASPLQEKSGQNTPCPVCSGEGKFPTRVTAKSIFNAAKVSLGIGKAESIEAGESKVVNTVEDTKTCLNCNGSGVSPWTAEGQYDFDTRKSEIASDINTSQPEISKLENRLSSGGHKMQYIGKSQTVFIGGVLNDLNSIRVDPEGKRKLIGNYSSESGKGVFPLYRAAPHVEQVAVNNLAGGDYFMQCANKFDLLVGANGIGLKTLGRFDIQGRIVTFNGDQVNISSDKEVSIDGGSNMVMTGDSVTICPRTQEVNGQNFKSVALDATVGVSGNAIFKGGTLIEGQTFVQGMSGPLEYGQSEPTLNTMSMKAGIEIGRVIGDKVFSVAAKDATVGAVTTVYPSLPTTFYDTNDEVRQAASALNGAEPVLAQPIKHRDTRKPYKPIQFLNPNLFALLEDCDDKDYVNNVDQFSRGEITEEELLSRLTNASDSPISETQRNNKDCDPCD